MVTRIVLIRHCEAQGNHERIFQGRTDADISENGKEQLMALAERCQKILLDAIYSSPLKRAYKTAEAANLHHNLPIKTMEDLAEINGGHWEGVRWHCLPKLFPEEYKAWEDAPHDFAPKGGESMKQVFDRIWNAIMAIVEENRGKTVAVVSHGCAIRNFLCRAKGLPIEKLNDIGWCDNTAISIIDFDEENRPRIMLLNDASHLTKEISTFAKQDWWRKQQGKRAKT